jgi:hypothetical protein
MSEAYREYAGKVREIDVRTADPRLIQLKLEESDLAQRTADTCHEIATALDTQTDPDVAATLEIKLFALKEVMQEVQSKRGILREIFIHQYNKPFPTLEESARDESAGSRGDEKKPEKKKDRKHAGGSTESEDESSADGSDDQEGFRTWTSVNGKFQIRAKLVQVKDGMVTLLTPKGRKMTLPKEKLSEADQRVIEEAASSSSSSNE